MDIEAIVLGLSYLGIFILMIFNGIFSFPSSQILYIIVGYFIGLGNLSFEYAVIAGAIGNTIGNFALYEMTREHGVSYALKFLPTADRHLSKAEKFFAKGGIIYLFLGKILPALKVFVPIIGGITKTPRTIFAEISFFGSVLWAIGLISIGLYFGKNFQVYETYVPVLIFISVLLIIFFLYSYTRASKEGD